MVSSAPQNSFAIGDTYGWPPPPPMTLPGAKIDTGKPSQAFKDVLDTINPLEHIPIVSSIYNALTGNQIAAGARIVGDTIYGGVLGFFSALANTVTEAVTGKDIGGDLAAYFGFGSSAKAPATKAAAGNVAAASPAGASGSAPGPATAATTAATTAAASTATLSAPTAPEGSPPPLPAVSMRRDETEPGAAPGNPGPAANPAPKAAPMAAPRPIPLVARAGEPHFIPLDGRGRRPVPPVGTTALITPPGQRAAAGGAVETRGAFWRSPGKAPSTGGAKAAPAGSPVAPATAASPAPPDPSAPPPPLPEAGMLADEKDPPPPAAAGTIAATATAPVAATAAPPVPVSYSAATSSLASANYAKALELSRQLENFYHPHPPAGPAETPAGN